MVLRGSIEIISRTAVPRAEINTGLMPTLNFTFPMFLARSAHIGKMATANGWMGWGGVFAFQRVGSHPSARIFYLTGYDASAL